MNLEKFRKWQITGRTYQHLELEEMEPCTCRNCGQVFKGQYCPNCGQKANVRRLEFMGAIKEFLPLVYNFDAKFLRTCLELCTRPGHMIRDYIVERKRRSYNNPVALLFILVTILLVLQFLFYGESGGERHILDGIPESSFVSRLGENVGPYVYSIYHLFDLIYQNMALTTLLSMLFYVLPNKISFRKTELGKHLNLTEHFYLMVYVACIDFIISIVLLPYHYYMDEASQEGHMTCSFLVMWIVFMQFYQITLGRSFKLTLYSVLMMFLLVVFFLTILITLFILICGSFFGTLIETEL